MADNTHSLADTPPAMDYPAHEQTYAGFIGLVKWATIILAIVLLGMYFFLV